MSGWLKRKSLPLWLWGFELCERNRWTENNLFYWLGGMVARCTSWRFRVPEEQR